MPLPPNSRLWSLAGRGTRTRISPGSSPGTVGNQSWPLGSHTLALSSWTVPWPISLVPKLVWGVLVKTQDDPDGLETCQLGKICHRK